MATDDSTQGQLHLEGPNNKTGSVIYKPIKGYDGYEVGSDGSVVSHRMSRRIKGSPPVILKQSKARSGLNVGLYLGPKQMKTFLVHRLVLEAFIGPCPPGMECCHNDGNYRNNRLDNLRWDTHKSNILDRMRHGKAAAGERHGCAVLTADQVREIRKLADSKAITHSEIAKIYKVGRPAISAIAGRRSWKSLPE